jgi:hypothetical protein
MTPCWRRVRRLVAPGVLAVSLAISLAAAQNPPPPAQMDGAFVTATVESLGAVVKREYIDADLGAKAEVKLRQSLADGRFAAAPTPAALATLMSRDLYDVTHDKHLAVEAVRDAPGTPRPTAAQADEARARAVQQANYGVRRAEILPGNVGILDLSSFFRPEEARDAIAKAMKSLSKADALILDMRANGGGSPGTVAILMSYLIDEPRVPLFEIVHRAPEPADKYATDSTPPAERDALRPVHVLTSSRTFSAGEGLAFLLQERHRAEVVGEQTAGAANPGKPYPVNDRFTVTVPNGRVRSAIGGGNWEGTGVTPDVQTTAAEALPVAYARVIRRLIAHEPPGPRRDALQQLLANPPVKE